MLTFTARLNNNEQQQVKRIFFVETFAPVSGKASELTTVEHAFMPDASGCVLCVPLILTLLHNLSSSP